MPPATASFGPHLLNEPDDFRVRDFRATSSNWPENLPERLLFCLALQLKSIFNQPLRVILGRNAAPLGLGNKPSHALLAQRRQPKCSV